MKTLTYEDYQRKVAGLKTPEDVAAFLREVGSAALESVGGEGTASSPIRKGPTSEVQG